jgi:hypothetical protein
MNAAIDTLTPAEAAVVAGVSVRDVHRVIDEHILPEDFYDTQEARSFTSDACVFIAFYLEAAGRLTSEERQRAIALASRHSSGQTSFTKIVRDGFLTIDFAPFRTGVDERLQRLNAARGQVSVDDEILGGTPTIRGTPQNSGQALSPEKSYLRLRLWSGRWNSLRFLRKRTHSGGDPGSALFRPWARRSSRLAASRGPLRGD